MPSDHDHLAPRPHGAVRDTRHAEFFDAGHRNLPEPADLTGQPERQLVVDDYGELVRGEGQPPMRDGPADTAGTDR